MIRLAKMRLGEILVKEGMVTPEQLGAALQAQGIYGGRLGTNLVEQGFLRLDALTVALAKRHGVPGALEKELTDIPATTIALIPARLAGKHQCIPVRLEARPGRKLHVAFRDPHTIAAIDELRFVANARIIAMVASELRI